MARMRRGTDAMDAYQRAVRLDPDHAEAHFNLARLCETVGDVSATLRHLAEYKRIRLREFMGAS